MFIWGDLIRREEAKEEPKGQKKFSGLRMRLAFRKKTEARWKRSRRRCLSMSIC